MVQFHFFTFCFIKALTLSTFNFNLLFIFKTMGCKGLYAYVLLFQHSVSKNNAFLTQSYSVKHGKGVSFSFARGAC